MQALCQHWAYTWLPFLDAARENIENLQQQYEKWQVK
jgi:hypothetical protein